MAEETPSQRDKGAGRGVAREGQQEENGEIVEDEQDEDEED